MNKPTVGQPGYGVDPKLLADQNAKKEQLRVKNLPNKPSWKDWMNPANQPQRAAQKIKPDTESDTPKPRKRIISVKDL